MKIVTVDQMRRLEEACGPLGTSTDDLMEQAGLEVARFARSLLGTIAGHRVMVLVGPGNNGGDGLVVARHLQRWGAAVTAYLLPSRPDHDPKLQLALAEGVSVCSSTAMPAGQINSPGPSPYLLNSPTNSSSPGSVPMVKIPTRLPRPARFHGTAGTNSHPRFRT